MRAFAHQQPDRTPLFEILCAYHPIYWDICGRTIATDAVMAWDAMADGVVESEFVEASAQAQFAACKFFEFDMVRLTGCPRAGYVRPVKTGIRTWMRNGLDYVYNDRTHLVELANPARAQADSNRVSEEQRRREIETWDGGAPDVSDVPDPVVARVRELAGEAGIDWVYMAEIGAGTGAAFYPPFQLMWMAQEPDLVRRWLDMQKAATFPRTEAAIRNGCEIVAMGGDVSCDKGPFISPQMYRDFLLPVIREHVDLIHRNNAMAVYTSDGNHWPIKEDLFFNSAIDGYKEVDKAAGMTWPRLIAAGVSEKVCIIGNLDARHTLCHGTPDEVRADRVGDRVMDVQEVESLSRGHLHRWRRGPARRADLRTR